MADDKDKAQQQLKVSALNPGDRYVHYKGGEYEVVTCAVKEDTLEPLVHLPQFSQRLRLGPYLRQLERIR